MLIITDLKNNTHALLAKKTIKKELNGDHTIELEVHQQRNNSLDLNSIDYLWTVTYKRIDYKIVYIDKITKGNSFYLKLKGKPLFYDEFSTSVIHYYQSGSKTADDAFGRIFRGTNYSYRIIDGTVASNWDSFGKGASRLKLFKQALDKYELEFYISGKTIYLKRLIGDSTNFLYKHKLNASDIKKSIDATSMYTHVKGFGNMEEGEDDYLNKSKLKREYTSPLVNILGLREAPPVLDGRIKKAATLDNFMKKVVDDSLNVTVSATLYDLRNQGYPHGIPKIGDRTHLIDERINLKQEIRVFSVTEVYSETGELIDCNVDFGSQDIAKRKGSALTIVAKKLEDLFTGKVKLPVVSLESVGRDMIRAIHSASSEIIFGDFGMMAISKTNPNHVFGVNSKGWYISTDGGKTPRTIATANGIVADAITAGTMSANRIAGGMLKSLSNSMIWDLNNNKLDFYEGATINFHSNSNSILQTLSGVTAFLNFSPSLSSRYPGVVLGVSQSGNSANSDDFVGFKAQIAKATPLGISQAEIFGERIVFDGDGGASVTGSWLLQTNDSKTSSKVRRFTGINQDKGYKYELGGISTQFDKVWTKYLGDNIRVIGYPDGIGVLLSPNLKNGIKFSDSGLELITNGSNYKLSDLIAKINRNA